MFSEIYRRFIASILSFFMSVSVFCGGSDRTAPDLALDRITQYSGGVCAAQLYDAGSGSEPDWKDVSADNDHYVQAVSSTTDAEFDAYRQKLRDAGWQEIFYNLIETSRFYAYRKGDQQIYMSFCGRTGEARLMDDSCSLDLGSFGYTTNDAGKAVHRRDLQVLNRPFPLILHKKFRKYVSIPEILLFCLSEKLLAQNCGAPYKQDFFGRTRQSAAGIPSYFKVI